MLAPFSAPTLRRRTARPEKKSGVAISVESRRSRAPRGSMPATSLAGVDHSRVPARARLVADGLITALVAVGVTLVTGAVALVTI